MQNVIKFDKENLEILCQFLKIHYRCENGNITIGNLPVSDKTSITGITIEANDADINALIDVLNQLKSIAQFHTQPITESTSN